VFENLHAMAQPVRGLGCPPANSQEGVRPIWADRKDLQHLWLHSVMFSNLDKPVSFQLSFLRSICDGKAILLPVT
jgi:hypothetical protein